MTERLNMNAYYYHFNETGIYAIDKILSAVADAGNGCHNTEDWSEYGYPEKIQKAAEEAAERDKKIQEALEVAYDLLTSVTGHKVSIGSIDNCYQANLYVTSVDEAIRKIKQAKEGK